MAVYYSCIGTYANLLNQSPIEGLLGYIQSFANAKQ